jgi:hypothetical protein
LPFAFPYKKEKLPNGNEVFRPTIPIEISYQGKSMAFVAIIDSGSDISYIPKWVSDALGIKIKGKTDFVDTINGKIKVVEDFVNVAIRHGKDVERFVLPVDIPVDEEHTDEIIIGRKGFFDRFDITFKENSRRIVLVKSRRT